ncbi:MAG: GNAT family N-acetyltransferase [Alphaproteobacteria bacterium]|nr:GNAT family N-acetyltransferase [Alphaproteobacteria bacterium]
MPVLKTLFGSRPRWPSPDLHTKLTGPNVVLRVGDPEDWRNWSRLRSDSRDFLVPWEPKWATDALSYGYFCSNLRRQWREWNQGAAYAFLIFQRDAKAKDGASINGFGTLVGSIALNEVQRGVSQKGTLGYWIGQPYADHGLMTEAAGLVCDFAFKTLKLHRLEASCLPHNEPSKRLLLRLGFNEEGYARDYLRINGQWEDHLLWGKVNPEE